MGKLTRKRKTGYTIAIIFFALCLVVAVLPVWFPWVLQPVLQKYGVRYTSYERSGYGRFVLKDVNLSEPKMIFEAARVEGLLPGPFLWRLFRDDKRENYLRVSGWNLQLLETGQEKETTTSVYQVSEQLDPVLAQLNRWLPRATLTDGVIHLDKKEISLPDVSWGTGKITGRIISDKLLPETTFTANFSKSSRQISWKSPAWNLEGELTVQQDREFLKIDGGVTWQSNRFEVAARFGRTELLPLDASVQSKSFRVPKELLNLEGYRELTGSLDARWQSNRFAVEIAGQAQPIESEETFLSPIDAELRASGDTNSIRIETANVFSPWLQAKLSQNVDLNYRGEMVSPVVTLTVAGDLSHQNWIPARGQLTGEAILRRGKDLYPDTTFELSGVGVEIGKLSTEQIDLQGTFEWPWLGIHSAKMRFKEGGHAEANLRFNAVSRRVTDGSVKFDGKMGGQFLPPEISYESMLLRAKISGPLKNLAHSAHVEVQQVKLPNVPPLGVVADWEGTMFNLTNFQANVSAKNLSIALSGSLEVQTNQVSAQIENLVLSSNAQPVLQLEKAFAVSWSQAGTNAAIRLEPLRLHGDKTEVSLSGEIRWPDQGVVTAAARELTFAMFQDFSEGPLPEVKVERFDLSANWTNGPVNFLVDGVAKFAVEDGTIFTSEIRAGGNGEGVSIEQARAGNGQEAVISGKGFLPISINPVSQTNLVQILPKQRIDFQATTLPNPQFWEQISKWTHATIQEPSGSIAVSGTFDAPSGKVLLSAKELLFKPADTNQPIPRLQNLVADFDLARDRIVLQRFEFLVEGQPVTATGELPLPDHLETNWQAMLDWRKARVHLKMGDAQIAPFQRLFPKFLSPLGTINLDVTAAGGKLEGELRVAGAALRPIPSLGPIHDIQARVRLLGDEVKLETFTGSIGGQPVELTGQITLPKKKDTTLPPFNFTLRGTNVPLAREPEMILRSDIDLTVSNKKGGTPLVSGTLNLRDSFYLSDLKALIPGKVAKAEQRPPYFSLETEPFSNWRLDVVARGTNFFKVRSPIFRGEISTALKIEGTLQEPVAIGDTRISSGVVLFPFANLRVDQGFVSLTSENPYRPQLSVSASARSFGYDVKMNLSGPADTPVVEFSSNPALTSEQILMMITAGELPKDEISFSAEQKAGRLAFFLGKSLFSKFGSTEESKLEIRSGDDISEQGRQTYFIEYKLTLDWSIVGEYDRFGGVNAGVKWIFFSK